MTLRERMRDPRGRPKQALEWTSNILIVLALGTIPLGNGVPGTEWHEIAEKLEQGILVLFTAEYMLRLYLAERASKYACSFYGLIDLLTRLLHKRATNIVKRGVDLKLTLRSLHK